MTSLAGRRPILLVLIALTALVLDPAGLSAAEEGGIDPVESSGLKRWDLAIWTLLVFGGLVFILGRFAWGPIMKGLAKREQNILDARDEAVKLKQEAESIRDQLRQELNQAHQKAREIVDEARRDGQSLVEEMRVKAQGEIQSERDRLRREVEMAKDQALQEIWTQSVQLASLMSTKAVQREMSPEDHRRLLDESLAELGGKLHGNVRNA